MRARSWLRLLPALAAVVGGCDGSDADTGAGTSGTTGSTGTTTACAEGMADCDGDASNGCEVSLDGAAAHCGACDHDCGAAPHVTSASCSAGACVAVGCDAGWDDCNHDAEDGCEVEVASSNDHCGACGNACAVGPHASAVACQANACVLACDAGWGDCDPTEPGCETDLGATDTSCGACGRDCGPGGCASGACVPVALVADAGKPFDLALGDDGLYWADTTGSIRRVDLATSLSEVVWGGEISPGSLALTDDYVYWSTWSPENAIKRGKRDQSGAAEVLCGPQMADSLNPMGLGFSGPFLVWVDFGAPPGMLPGIHAFIEDPGPACIKVQEDAAPFVDTALTAFDTWFWTQLDPATGVGTLKEGPLPVPTYVADATRTDPDLPTFVAVDATHVYWTTANGKVVRAPTDDLGAAETLYKTTSATEPTTFGIAVDAKFVYFAAGAVGTPDPGAIYRLRKPALP